MGIDSDTDRKEKPDIPVACRQNNFYPPSERKATVATILSRKDTLSLFNRVGKAAAFPLLNINNLVYASICGRQSRPAGSSSAFWPSESSLWESGNLYVGEM